LIREITFTKSALGSLKVSEADLIGVYAPLEPAVGMSDEKIRDLIQSPRYGRCIRERAKGTQRALIVTDDNTRPTPVNRLLPFVLDELAAAGISMEQTQILTGLGTHRPMSRVEIRDKFGLETAGKIQIINHTWQDKESLVKLDRTESDLDVIINRKVLESDFIIAMGNIIPHATAGFSGGGKVIMPGICGEATIADTHWMALDYAMKDILGVEENPVRWAIREVCQRIGLSCIVDAVMVGDRVADVVVGDPIEAHGAGVRRSRELYGVKVDELADIVVAEAYPTDIDLRQAIKAVCSADMVVRDGGVIVLAAECPEGVSPQFPEFERRGFRDPDGLYKEVESGRFMNKLLAYTLVAVGRIICGRVKGILVSPYIDKNTAGAMGFVPAGDLNEALALAEHMTGKDKKVTILRNAGELLPLMEQQGKEP
jgi:nickel-dependent lactate racemase